MEQDYKMFSRPHWPCLFTSANDEQKIINNLSSSPSKNSSPVSNATVLASSPITSGNLNKLLDEQRVYEHRAFSSDIIRTIGKNEKYLTGYKRIGCWIDVGDGWVCWKLSAGNILLLEPITFIFHNKIKEMGAKLNIRRHPSPTSEVLETVDCNVIFKATAIKGDWLQINLTQTMNLYKKRQKSMGNDIIDSDNKDDDNNGDKIDDVCQEGEEKRTINNVKDDVIGYVLMRTPDFELLVEKKFEFNWLIEEAGFDEELDSLSDKSSPSRSPSFDLRSSPVTTYNNIDERPLPTTLKKLNSYEKLQGSPSTQVNNSNKNISTSPVSRSPLLSINRKSPENNVISSKNALDTTSDGRTEEMSNNGVTKDNDIDKALDHVFGKFIHTYNKIAFPYIST